MGLLAGLCLQANNHEGRRNYIHEILRLHNCRVSFEGKDYRQRQFDRGSREDGRPDNLVVTFHDNPTHKWVFCAHYDIDPGTTHGANDNTASVCQLLRLCLDLQNEGFEHPDLTILFSDLEEPGNGAMAHGAYEYCKSRPINWQPEFVLVLDVCGIGDTVGISSALHSEAQTEQFKALLIDTKTPYKLKQTPPSDNVGFSKAGHESVLMIVLPEEEFEATFMVDTWKGMHTPNDDITRISTVTMHTMRRNLREWVRALDFRSIANNLTQQVLGNMAMSGKDVTDVEFINNMTNASVADLWAIHRKNLQDADFKLTAHPKD